MDNSREYLVLSDPTDEDSVLYDGEDFSEAMSTYGSFERHGATIQARWPGETWGSLTDIDTYDHHYPE